MKDDILETDFPLTRRAALGAITATMGSVVFATETPAPSKLGLVAYNCGLRRKWMQQRDPKIDLFEPLTFLKHCHSLGTGGMQTSLGVLDVARVKSLKEFAAEHKLFDGRTVDQGHDAASWTVPYGPWELAPGEKPAPGGYQDPARKARLAEALKQGKPASGPATEACDIPDNAYHDGGVAHTAAKRIREFAKKEQPFFLAVGFVKPHLPFIAPKKYWDLYDRASLPLAPFQQLPKGSPNDLAFYSNSGELRAYSDVPKTGPIPEALQRELIHGYAACASYIDAQVGLLMQTLEECGVADDTIICFWGDHGWHLGEHGHWGKLTNYEDAARAPLIISAPGVAGGKRVTALTEFLDVYPTLCELAGLPIPSHAEGKSLVPLMRGEDVTLHEAALTQMSHGRGKNGTMGWSIRTPRYRYIEWRAADFSADKPVFGNHAQATELYDYATDPLERKNLADKVDRANLVKQHQVLFDQLLPHLPARE
jgi:iduronate 2-sulfatase